MTKIVEETQLRPKGKLHFTIGLPRSGKSTFCREWVRSGVARTIIEADAIRIALTGHRFNTNAEGEF